MGLEDRLKENQDKLHIGSLMSEQGTLIPEEYLCPTYRTRPFFSFFILSPYILVIQKSISATACDTANLLFFSN